MEGTETWRERAGDRTRQMCEGGEEELRGDEVRMEGSRGGEEKKRRSLSRGRAAY